MTPTPSHTWAIPYHLAATQVTLYLSSRLDPTYGTSPGCSRVSSHVQGLRRNSYPSKSHSISSLFQCIHHLASVRYETMRPLRSGIACTWGPSGRWRPDCQKYGRQSDRKTPNTGKVKNLGLAPLGIIVKCFPISSSWLGLDRQICPPYHHF